MRELWLDRAVLFVGVLLAAWFIVVTVNVALPINWLWVLVPLGLFLWPFIMYAASVKPSVFTEPLLNDERAALIRKITGAHTVIFGHTHQPVNKQVGPMHYINGGSWSPAFREPECQTRLGTQTYVWLRRRADGQRQAELHEWPPGASKPLPFDIDGPLRVSMSSTSIRPVAPAA
jgi:hypothetical protein